MVKCGCTHSHLIGIPHPPTEQDEVTSTPIVEPFSNVDFIEEVMAQDLAQGMQ